MTDKDRLLAIANDALNRVCDHDLRGNPITDYSVLMMGAYSPAVHRIVDAVAAELAAKDAEIARLNTAFLEVCDERDHWHSRALIGDSKEITLRDEIARLQQINADQAKAIAGLQRINAALMLCQQDSTVQVPEGK